MHSLNLRILSQNCFQPNVVHTIAKFSKSRPALDPTTVKRSAGGCLNDFWPIYFEVHCNLEVIRVHWCNVWSSSHYKQLTSGFFDPPWRKLMMMPRRRRIPANRASKSGGGGKLCVLLHRTNNSSSFPVITIMLSPNLFLMDDSALITV